ncbi:MAG: gamma-glutamyltransferase, partial [Rhodospirillales bacterium]|nr:gamma-glutamyltransferase [Rhodospirillales bacterium]
MREFFTSKDQPYRPAVVGTRHSVSAGHYLAAQAAMQILEAGGNAVDAAVAGGLALNVVESTMTGIAGVAPIMVYMAEAREAVTISGLGWWPKAASCEFFNTHHGGTIPLGVLQSVVPGALDAWVTALERFGTMSFADVSAEATRLARDGFVMYPLMAERIEHFSKNTRKWPSNAEIYLPGGEAPQPGDLFVQSDLGRTLQFLADEEGAHSGKGRAAGLDAVRHAFYQGDIAASIIRHQSENGGLMTAEDLAGFRVEIEPSLWTRFHDTVVHECGPWCQGPMLLQALNLVEGIDLRGLGHNSAAYIHTLVEAIKLAAADRDAYYGDPRFVDVPMEALLSKDYAAGRQAMIRPNKAWPDMPPAGVIADRQGSAKRTPAADEQTFDLLGHPDRVDTSYICVVDCHGNAVSATPSDGAASAQVVPGTGIATSPRGRQSWTDPDHAACIAPGKRPRLTPNPAFAVRDDGLIMPFGTPGGDTQVQVMLQV